MEGYIIPHRALKKLRACKSIGNVAYIFGATGFGKTELVREYLKNKQYMYISCADSLWNYTELVNSIGSGKTQSIVVIDDLYLLLNEEKRRDVIELTKRDDIWLVLISRSNIPGWLCDAYIKRNFILISEEDLALTCADVTEYLEHAGFEFPREDIAWIVEKGEGNGFAVKYAVVEMINNIPVNKELDDKIRSKFLSLLKEKVLIWLEPEVKELLMKLSLAESFDIELAKVLTSDKNISEVIVQAEESGNFLRKNDGIYTIRRAMKTVLLDELHHTCTHEQINGFIRNIALYYEMNGNETKAFEYYEKCNDMDRIRDMLVKNARVAPDIGFFYEMRK